ncbi:LPS assembly lipoprotein LptE [Variovorax sp.]|uniref:LPS-assembly lipoprotein LptE n=1 Tax=Variovorax sp. TaxID=1871043 RepID=UPI002D67589B|nr:LPS assembly lipoprotein LptE [Variovorax sp.]HYP84110.1 LPS assembly lipoprotein LptE [Variovorax sp.]
MTARRFDPTRRLLIAGGGASLALAGCGFKLREAPNFAFHTIALAETSPYLKQLKRAIEVTGTLKVLPMAEASNAEAVFDLLGESRDRVVLSTNSAGQVREMQLYLRVRFRVRTPAGKELIAPSLVEQWRDITYNETAALAKENEEQLLYRDMTSDVVQQTLRRLAAVKAV